METLYTALITWLEHVCPDVAWHRKGDDDTRPEHVARADGNGQYGTVFIADFYSQNLLDSVQVLDSLMAGTSHQVNATIVLTVYRLNTSNTGIPIYPADTLMKILRKTEIDAYTQDDSIPSLAAACPAIDVNGNSLIVSGLVPNQRVNEQTASVTINLITASESLESGEVVIIDGIEGSCSIDEVQEDYQINSTKECP